MLLIATMSFILLGILDPILDNYNFFNKKAEFINKPNQAKSVKYRGKRLKNSAIKP